MSCAVDHLIVAAATLEQGVQWCEATLGVSPGAGGRHPLMGTHNRLLKIDIERFPDAYLEIIAIDPGAHPPQRVRWFGLDDPALQALLALAPRLIHFVLRTTGLDALRQQLIQAGLQPGEPLNAGRDTSSGPLQWQILVRPDGRPLFGGALPTLLQWQGRHPAAGMPASGVTLQALALSGVPGPAAEALGLASLAGVSVSAAPGPALLATLATPLGLVTLESS